ncbi:tRNA wybutosine-synthesizing protein 3 homolog [Excalfactoria chinensis]|uniref:tRNA wybutosine-synthesizing protein 3 homolog n=1 Tax=Excalfactoria chinensis TaxID=46218 RepID=UPI003B3AA2AC
MAAFGRWKEQRLSRSDCSRKGALDERAAGAVRLLNRAAPFCTTSSCAGRIVLAEGRAGLPGAVPKQRCRWLLVAHEPCGQRDVMAALQTATGDVVFKFEPFVLHVMCRELQDAQLLHSVAIESGFKNSGITIGKGGKIMMAVRSAQCLEVPLSHMGKLMVSEEYIEFLVQVANRKMEENAQRIDRFYKHLEAALEAAGSESNSPSTDAGQARAVYVHRRKRRTARVQDVLPSPEHHNNELEPGDDPEGSLDIFAGITLCH